MKIVCVIPARGGSKRLPRKNIYPLLGKPLICWSIDACLKSKYLNSENIFVSTEDQEIKNLVSDLGINVIDRPKNLSEDSAWTQDVLSHAKAFLIGHGMDFDIMVRVQANSPQVQPEKIDECIEKLINRNLWEVFTVDQDGVEDAAIHALLRKCVDQKALSVYKGVVSTNYTDIHTIDDIKLVEKEISTKEIHSVEYSVFKKNTIDISKKLSADMTSFLEDQKDKILKQSLLGFKCIDKYMNKPDDLPDAFMHCMTSWHWNDKVSITDRLDKSLSDHEEFFKEINKKISQGDRIKILDLGSGFCTYWPVFCELGVSEIVGIDLYDDRSIPKTRSTLGESVIKLCNMALSVDKILSSSQGKDVFSVNRQDLDNLFSLIHKLYLTLFEVYSFNSQYYLYAASLLVDRFTSSDFSYRIFKGNARHIDLLLSPEDLSSFDGIMCLNPGSENINLGTGIPAEIFHAITKKYLKDDGVTAFDRR